MTEEYTPQTAEEQKAYDDAYWRGLHASQKLVSHWDNKDLVEENANLKRLQFLDKRTGLLTKEGIEEAFEKRKKELGRRRTDETKQDVGDSILFIDLDKFSDANESLGHLNADKLLMVVGQFIQGTLREDDVVAGRFGGDEFVAILPNTSVQNAAIAGERLLAAINGIDGIEGIPHQQGASIGVGPLDYEYPLDHSMETADKAMYEAKSNGRNQVVVFDPSREA